MDISELVIKVSTDGVEKADRATSKLTATAGKLVAAFAAVAAGAGAAGFALHKIVEVTSEAEKAQARLRSVGIQSANDIKEVFDILEEMSSKPPFGLEETTEAFVKLVDKGLDPSKKALEAYSDLAVGTGRSLTGVVDAIALAANGQTRALVQFGIKATQEMDGLVVTFRGNTEKIKGDAASIEQYMQKVAAQNYLGAAAAVADTMGGKLDMLKDSWDDVWRAVSDSGVGQAIKDALDMATAALAELEAQIKSGQLEAYLVAIADRFAPFAQAASDAFNFISKAWSKAMDGLGADTDSVLGFIVRSFTELPENVTAVVKGIGATFGLLVEYASATGKGVYDTVVAYLNLTYASAKNLGALLKDAVLGNASAAFADYYVKQRAEVEKYSKTVVDNWNRTTSAIGNATDAWGGVVTEIMDERDAALQGFKDKITGADAEREAWNKLQAARMAAHKANDPLGAHRKPRGNTVSEESRQQYESLRQGLILEEDAVRESYAKRLQLIRDNTIAGSEERIALEKALAEREAVELVAAREATAARLQKEYQEQSSANWESYQEKVKGLGSKGVATIKAQNLAMYSSLLSTASDISSGMQSLVDENSGAAKTMFAISKAVAIAQAIVATELAAVQAAAAPDVPLFGMKVAASSAIRAMGYASVAVIAAQAVQGFKDGGIVGGTSYTGDRVAARVNSGEMILNFAQQRELWNAANGGGRSGNGGGTTVNIINQAGVSVTQEQRTNEDGSTDVNILVRAVENSLSQNVAAGRGTLGKTLGLTYGLKRRAA